MNKFKVLGMMILGIAAHVPAATFNGRFDCEIKMASSSSPGLFSVGDRLKLLPVAESDYIAAEFVHVDGAISKWNQVSHPFFNVQINPPAGFKTILKGHLMSGDFIEKNSIEIEDANSTSGLMGAWIHLSIKYGSNRDLSKIYATCSFSEEKQ